MRYSHAAQAGNTLYIAGQIAKDLAGNLARELQEKLFSVTSTLIQMAPYKMTFCYFIYVGLFTVTYFAAMLASGVKPARNR